MDDVTINDILERPKPSLDLDQLLQVKKRYQELSDQTNARLKKNVYENYGIFIETPREIAILKSQMATLNSLFEGQYSSMNKFIDQSNKLPIITSKPKIDTFRLELNEETSEVEADMLPSWYTKSPEDFDVLIAQRNLKEAVELAQKVKAHLEQYPNVHSDLKNKIDSRVQELINAICAELQPATGRSVQGGPRSSVASIHLLRDLKLSSKAVKLYLDQRSSLLNFVLKQQTKSASSLQFNKQISSIFFHNVIETCNEFKQAFDLSDNITQDIGTSVDLQPIDYQEISTFSCFIYWTVQELENFITFFKGHVFNSGLSNSMIAESVYHFSNQLSRLTTYCAIDMNKIGHNQLEKEIYQVVMDCDEKLMQTTKKLIKEELWQAQQFDNNAQMSRFFEDMNDVDLKTMPSYISEDHKLPFTSCKTSFARYYLITLKDLAKLVNNLNRNTIENVLTKSFALEMDSVVEALKQCKSPKNQCKKSKVRFIMGNSNFLLDKVIKVADQHYKDITGEPSQKLFDLRADYKAKVEEFANMCTNPTKSSMMV